MFGTQASWASQTPSRQPGQVPALPSVSPRGRSPRLVLLLSDSPQAKSTLTFEQKRLHKVCHRGLLEATLINTEIVLNLKSTYYLSASPLPGLRRRSGFAIG